MLKTNKQIVIINNNQVDNFLKLESSQPTMKPLKYIEEYKDLLEDSLQDLFQGCIEDYLNDNCQMITEDYGEDWLDRDIKAAKEEIKMKFQDFINNIK